MRMKRTIITGFFVLCTACTFAQEQVPVKTKKEDKLEKKSDKELYDYDRTQLKLYKQKVKEDKRMIKRHKQERKEHAEQRAANRTLEKTKTVEKTTVQEK